MRVRKSAVGWTIALIVAGMALVSPGYAAGAVPGDVTPPVLTMQDRTASASQPSGAWVVYDMWAWDEGDNAYVPASCAPASGSLFPLGTTTVNCSATDSSGNVATGSFIVTVIQPDFEPPVLYGVPASPVVLEPTNPDGSAWYSYWVNATDNWDGFTPVTCNPLNGGGNFPTGTTTVTCTATDSWGNTATASFTVTVLPPRIATVTITGGTVTPKTGVATIYGTIGCTRGGLLSPGPVSMYGSLTQRVGRVLISGTFGTMSGGAMIECSSLATPWSFTAVTSNGLLVAGRADVKANAYAGSMGPSTTTEATIKLTPQQK